MIVNFGRRPCADSQPYRACTGRDKLHPLQQSATPAMVNTEKTRPPSLQMPDKDPTGTFAAEERPNDARSRLSPSKMTLETAWETAVDLRNGRQTPLRAR